MFFKRKTHIIVFNNEEFKVQENKTILFSLLKSQAKIKYSCGVGECKQCKFNLVSGKLKMETSEMLACKSYPQSDLVIQQY